MCRRTDSRYRLPRPDRSCHSNHGRDGCRQKRTLRKGRCLVCHSPWRPECAGLRPNARHRSGIGVRTQEHGAEKYARASVGGAAPKVCSQTRRRLGRSKPSRTAFRPAPVSFGIIGHLLFCSVKSSPMGTSGCAQFAARSSPHSRFEPASCAPQVGLSPATRSPGVGSQPCGAKYPGFCADSGGLGWSPYSLGDDFCFCFFFALALASLSAKIRRAASLTSSTVGPFHLLPGFPLRAG